MVVTQCFLSLAQSATGMIKIGLMGGKEARLGGRPVIDNREGKENIPRPSCRVPKVMFRAGHLSQWKLSMDEMSVFCGGRVRTDKVGLED